jgi:hypothetical protein
LKSEKVARTNLLQSKKPSQLGEITETQKLKPKESDKLDESSLDVNEVKPNRLWNSIDELDGLFNGKHVTYYDVNVTYQKSRVHAGIAFEENGMLNFDINLPSNLERQGIGTEIFKRATNDYSPSKVQGLWKSSNNYLGGESVNLTIFKQKLAGGMTEIQAVFETPTGKILKANGFGGTPTILVNTLNEIRVFFNP